MEAYGPFAQQHGWVVQPADGGGSNRDPDNPFYRPNPAAKFQPEARIAVLYGVGLASLDELIQTMWVDPDTGRPPSPNVHPPADPAGLCLVSSDAVTMLLHPRKLCAPQIADFNDAYRAQSPRRLRDPRIPDHNYDVDVDGAPYIIIDPDRADMTGWQLSANHGHSTSIYPFRRQTAYRSGTRWSLTWAIGDPVEAWTAFVPRRSRLIFFITPEGERLQL